MAVIHDDSRPEDARPRASAPVLPVQPELRAQAQAECELLAAIATHPEAMRPYAERIASLSWSDSRFEAMVWAMLATPAGTPAKDVVGAAIAVVADAPQILATARLAALDEADLGDRLEFIVDTAEYFSIKRQIASIRSRLKHGLGDAGTSDEQGLFAQATELQKRLSALQRKLSSAHKA